MEGDAIGNPIGGLKRLPDEPFGDIGNRKF
jgi:hypothetical protein